jgi:beta-fructofuranosidase
MLVCARVASGPGDRRGAVALLESDNLDDWETSDAPFWFPGITYAPECPEVFTLAGKEYMVFSTYSDRFATRHRMREEPASRWTVPAIDALESNDVYAMSSVEAEGQRFLVGWLSTRAGDSDSGHRQWGGDLVVHQLVPRRDGSLGTVPLQSVLAQFTSDITEVRPRAGEWSTEEGLVGTASSGLAWCEVGESGYKAQLVVDVDLESAAEEFGIAIRADDDFTHSLLLRFEPSAGRFVLDRRPHRIDVPFDWDSDRSYVSAADFDVERPLVESSGVVAVRILVDGSAITVYVGDVALTTRGYDLDGGRFALYCANGTASFGMPTVTASE